MPRGRLNPEEFSTSEKWIAQAIPNWRSESHHYPSTKKVMEELLQDLKRDSVYVYEGERETWHTIQRAMCKVFPSQEIPIRFSSVGVRHAYLLGGMRRGLLEGEIYKKLSAKILQMVERMEPDIRKTYTKASAIYDASGEVALHHQVFGDRMPFAIGGVLLLGHSSPKDALRYSLAVPLTDDQRRQVSGLLMEGFNFSPDVILRGTPWEHILNFWESHNLDTTGTIRAFSRISDGPESPNSDGPNTSSELHKFNRNRFITFPPVEPISTLADQVNRQYPSRRAPRIFTMRELEGGYHAIFAPALTGSTGAGQWVCLGPMEATIVQQLLRGKTITNYDIRKLTPGYAKSVARELIERPWIRNQGNSKKRKYWIELKQE